VTSDQSNRLVTLASRDVSLKFDRDYDANRQTALLTRAGVHGDATGDYQCRDQNHHIGTQNHRALPPHGTTTSATHASSACTSSRRHTHSSPSTTVRSTTPARAHF